MNKNQAMGGRQRNERGKGGVPTGVTDEGAVDGAADAGEGQHAHDGSPVAVRPHPTAGGPRAGGGEGRVLQKIRKFKKKMADEKWGGWRMAGWERTPYLKF